MVRNIFIVLLCLGASVANAAAVLGNNIASGDADSGPVEGVPVVGVSPGGPAEAAGLETGDVLVGIGGEVLTADSAAAASAALIAFMEAVNPGDRIDVDYLREGRSAQVTVVAGEFDPSIMRPGFPFRRSLEQLGDDIQAHVVQPLVRQWRSGGAVRERPLPSGFATE